jgi:hypothetical protein
LQAAGIKNGDALTVTLIDPPTEPLRNAAPASVSTATPSTLVPTSSAPAIAVSEGFLVQRVGRKKECLLVGIGLLTTALFAVNRSWMMIILVYSDRLGM